MTRMPKVIEEVTGFFGKEPHSKALIQMKWLLWVLQFKLEVLQGDVKDVVLLDVTPLSHKYRNLGWGVY